MEKSLWVTVFLSFAVIGLLTGAVFYYKIQAENMRKLLKELKAFGAFSRKSSGRAFELSHFSLIKSQFS